MGVKILTGDCMETLKELEDESIHMCVTSPPYYGLRDYGHDGQIGLEETPEEYVQKMVEVFREVKRVLRDDGTLWLNIGDSYAGSGKGGQSAEKRSKGWQPEYGNKGATYGLKPKDLIGIPWMLAFALRADGWYLRQDIIWHKPNPMPESVSDRCSKAHEYIFLLSKSKKYYYDHEAVKEPSIHQGRVVNPKDNLTGKYSTDGKAKKGYETHITGMRVVGSKRNKRSVWTVNTKPFRGAHFAVFPPDLIKPCILAGTPAYGCCSKCGEAYVRKIEKVDMGVTPEMKKAGANSQGTYEGRDLKDYASATMSQQTPKTVKQRTLESMSKANITIGWEVNCQCDADVVPAVVLDPFGGSGTTACVALEHGRNAVLCELNPEYVALAEERIENHKITVGIADERLEWL